MIIGDGGECIEIEKALGDNLSKDWRDSVQVREISSSCIFLLLYSFDMISVIYIFVFSLIVMGN